MYLINFIRGFCMALADSVPGVSGGTIAFLLGFYDDFIGSLDGLVAGNKEKKINSLKFLLKIGIGWIVGFLISMAVLGALFEEHIYQISSLFVGFILCSLPIIIKEEKESIVGKYKNIPFLIIGVAVVSLITYFNPVANGGSNVDLSNLSLRLGVLVFVAGMAAISAMVLPGISGSTILLIFGLYIPLVSAIKEILSFKFDKFLVVLIFGLGVITGVFVVIRGVKFVLEKYRSQTIYTILGLMIGSLYAIVQGPLSLETPKPALSFSEFSWIFFIIGGLLIFGLQKLKDVCDPA